MSVVDVPEAVKRAGADGLELREVYWKDKAAELPAVREKMSALGLRPTYATFTTLLNAEPAKREQLLVDLDDAHALGANILRVFRGAWPQGDDVETWRAARETIARAERYGIQLALENFVNVPGNRRVEVHTALLVFNTPTVQNNFDTSNYVLNGEDLLANAEVLRDFICYSHLKDVRVVEGKKQVVRIGAGELPFDRLLQIYDATGRDFPVTLEHPGEGDPERAIAQSLEHLHALGLPR
jgi:sugar phosphate isomerase/epimerase